MRRLIAILALAAFAVPAASAHGALTINEFDTYAISDFEGHEDSFPWEGFEIWDVYVGDGYSQMHASHGVYFKANFAGDGTLRPTGSAAWELRFTFTVGDESYERTIVHDGEDVTTDFEELEWQIADGNVLQVRAWAPVARWEDQQVTDLIVVSSVDGEPRDIAPGGLYDPATGTEVPFSAPATPVFPAMGEGRIVDAVELTGPEKFLNVTVTPQGDGWFEFKLKNPLAEQGQHVMFRAGQGAWDMQGKPAPVSLDGGKDTSFRLHLAPANATVIEPLRLDVLTDIGGLASFYAYLDDGDVKVVKAAGLAATATRDEPVVESPGLPLAWIGVALVAAFLRARRS